jgi:hypothetical protein
MGMRRKPEIVHGILESLLLDQPLAKTPEVEYHLRIMADAGLVKLEAGHMSALRDRDLDNYPEVARLTWIGHEYLERLEAMRQPIDVQYTVRHD